MRDVKQIQNEYKLSDQSSLLAFFLSGPSSPSLARALGLGLGCTFLGFGFSLSSSSSTSMVSPASLPFAFFFAGAFFFFGGPSPPASVAFFFFAAETFCVTSLSPLASDALAAPPSSESESDDGEPESLSEAWKSPSKT